MDFLPQFEAYSADHTPQCLETDLLTLSIGAELMVEHQSSKNGEEMVEEVMSRIFGHGYVHFQPHALRETYDLRHLSALKSALHLMGYQVYL